MYQLFFDGLPIYDPRTEDLLVREPEVHLAVGAAGEVSFVIDDDHPNASRLTKLKGILELQADGLPIFKGRIVRDTKDFNLSRQIEAEGLLACLNDSIIPPFAFPDDWENDDGYKAASESGNVVEFFLRWLLDQHNSQVGPAQQIVLGDVTVADSNNYIARASDKHATTMETVRGKLEELMGGYLLADYSGDTTVLHYYQELPLTNTQVVEYGENLLDLVNELDATETFTAILPVGKDGLTIVELPDGEISPGYVKQGSIIYSEEAEADYGGVRVVRLEEWQDVTLATNLQAKALARLSEGGPLLTQTITVKAVDLGFDQENGVSRFVVGRHVQIESRPHNFGAIYPLMELEPDITDPGNTNIVLGATIKSSTDFTKAAMSSTREQLGQQSIELGKQASNMNTLTQTVETQITEALQTSESILFSALEQYVETDNFEEFQTIVQSQFAILADEIVLKFEEANSHTVQVDGDLQQTLETLTKYFEFNADGLTIKAGDNTMTLALDNDVIVFRKNGRQFGWWDGVDFHTGNIVIDVTERAQFGNFAFVPRTNGSLSFLKVGG
jgi:hypothetical protein